MRRKIMRGNKQCSTKSAPNSCCKVEAVITIDERGQMVLPKDVRDKAGITAGDKLALIGCEKNGQLCCLTLVKVNAFGDSIKSILGPVYEDILK